MNNKFNQSNFLILLVITMGLLLNACQNQVDKEPWVKIFDGKTLNGWHVKGGKATYEVKDGAIVGTTVLNTHNTFLCSDEMYDDFILEIEYQVDPKLNSGIQIRSNSDPDYFNGAVHGYQVEVDPSERAWSGGIYDESRRGWLNTLENNPEAQAAFKQNQWNTYRIEAIGDTIKTWVNGVPAAHLVDDMTSSGIIGLQVHGVGNDKDKEGIHMKWRSVKIMTENLKEYQTASPIPAINTLNQLTQDEKKAGFKMLWDGKTTKGWKGAKLDHFPDKGWTIENGILSVLASGGGESEAGGDIVTEKKYSDFELKVDFKITEGANSGIKYFVDTELNKGKGSSIGLEYQILDDAKHPDAKKGNHEGSRTVSSLYDLIQADTSKKVKPVGQWNQARIVSKGTHVEHWLNGKKVLSYERRSPEFRKLVQESKYKKWPDFGEGEAGRILLQDHGDLVSFRNVKIKEINKN